MASATEPAIKWNKPLIILSSTNSIKWFVIDNYNCSQQGYSFAELYGTTYANGDQGNPLQVYFLCYGQCQESLYKLLDIGLPGRFHIKFLCNHYNYLMVILDIKRDQ